MRPSPRSSALLLAALLGCDAAQPPLAVHSDTVVVEPTAGSVPVVAVTESTAVVWRIGGFQPNPDDEISSNGGVMGLVALPDGRYLLNEASRVRVFDSTGAETWRFGREGAGPEEFGALGWPCAIRGDTVVITDQRNQRFALLDAGTGLIATVPAERRGLGSGACSGDGWLLLINTLRDSSRYERELYVVGSDLLTDTVVTTVPLARDRLVGAAFPMTGVIDTFLYVADPNAAAIRMIDRHGDFVRQIDWHTPRVAVTDENIPDRYGIVPMGATGAALDEWWDGIRSRPRAENWPAFVSIRTDAVGRFWIREDFDNDGPTADWWVVGLDGRLRAKVQFPHSTREHRVRLLGFVPDGIVLYSEDADGAPWVSVVGYPVELGRVTLGRCCDSLVGTPAIS